MLLIIIRKSCSVNAPRATVDGCRAPSACRGAVALGYRVVLVADGHTTWHTPVIDAERIIAHHNRLLAQGFADVVAADEVRF